MNPKRRILSLLRQRVLILDGAMGTELQKREMPLGVCPEAWCLTHPKTVAEIHAAYRDAGADVVYTSTFGANRLKMGRYNLTNVLETNRALAEVAVQAAGGGLVAGDIGPTGHFIEPYGDVSFEDAVVIFREQAQGLLEGGVDLFVIETMMDIQEARAALIAVREISDLFCIVTMTYEKHGRTLNGTDPASALVTLQSLGADAVGCNCSAGPEGMLSLIAAMKPYATVPLVAKPNAGLPKLVGEDVVYDMDTAGFADFGGPLAAVGVNIMGGCCGTTPAHIRALREALATVQPVGPVEHPAAAASSARSAVVLAGAGSLPIVGSRIDATQNETVRQGLANNDASAARQEARAQEKEGAQILLVKTGADGFDETTAARQIVQQVAPTSRSSLLLDSGRIETVEQTLRFYPGRALVRVPADRAEEFLPVIAKYGAIPILHPATTDGMPAKREEVFKALERAEDEGFDKREIVMDCTPSEPTHQGFRVALGMVAWCTRNIKGPTLLDLTAVGKDEPDRLSLQASILAVAQASGLCLAVLDPAAAEPMKIRAAGGRLWGNDQGTISAGKG